MEKGREAVRAARALGGSWLILGAVSNSALMGQEPVAQGGQKALRADRVGRVLGPVDHEAGHASTSSRSRLARTPEARLRYASVER